MKIPQNIPEEASKEARGFPGNKERAKWKDVSSPGLPMTRQLEIRKEHVYAVTEQSAA